MISGAEVPVQSVEDFKSKLKSSLEDAQYAYKSAKARQSAQSSKKFKTPDYEVESKLWINKTLFTDSYSTSQDSDKLSAKGLGPFTVKELIGKIAVRLELPAHF